MVAETAVITHRRYRIDQIKALLEMYWQMVRARRTDEHTWVLHRQGKAAFHISGRRIQVGAAYALRRGYDYVHLYYRDPFRLG
jgi:2-oxoisovalerate dehydrogenase E1 component alpha subunit